MDKLTNDEDDDDDAEETFFNDIYIVSSEIDELMTKHSDLETLSMCLNEKEKDLELAARIGKSLLERNKELQKTNDYLEEQVNLANEQVTQLKHELQQKVDLLQLVTELDSESGGSSPAAERLFNWNILQKKLVLLEDENLCLKLEANHLKSLTQNLEEKEHQLINDCVKQLSEANSQIGRLSQEVQQKTEQCSMHKRQVDHLHKDLSEKHQVEKKLQCENEELTVHLQAAQETQMELAQELADLQDRYAEIVAMLAETREELKHIKEHGYFPGRSGSPLPDSVYDSLASELEASDSGVCSLSFNEKQRKSQDSQLNLLRLMENLKLSLQKEEQSRRNSSQEMINLQKTSTPIKIVQKQSNSAEIGPDCPGPGVEGSAWRAKGICKEIEMSLQSSPITHTYSKESLYNFKRPPIGVPGIPGSKDLEHAIKRLSLRRRVELEFQKYRQEKCTELLNFNQNLVSGLNSLVKEKSPEKPELLKSPTKAKVVVVKPLEGSETLSQWKSLATPSLTGLLSRRPGIKVKSGSPPAPLYSTNDSTPKSSRYSSNSGPPFRSGLDSGISSDVETSNVSHFFVTHANQCTPGTNSIVTSQILHPSENVTLPELLNVVSSSGTSTFSTAFSLAQALKERCVDVVSGTWWEWPARVSPMVISSTGGATADAITDTNYSEKPPSEEKVVVNKSSGLESLLNETSDFLPSPMESRIVTRASMRKCKSKGKSKC